MDSTLDRIYKKYLTLDNKNQNYIIEKKLSPNVKRVKYCCFKLKKLYSTHDLKFSTWKGLAKEMNRILNHKRSFKTKLQAKEYILSLIDSDKKINKKIKTPNKIFEPKTILRKKINYDENVF